MKHNYLKVFTLFIITLMCFSLVACTNKDEKHDNEINYDEPFDSDIYDRDMLSAFNLLRSIDEELYGAEVNFNQALKAGYIKNDDKEELAILVDEDASLYDEENDITYLEDPADARYYLVSNYKNIDEIETEIEKHFNRGIIDTSLIANNFMEFDGHLYLVRGGRGYGILLSEPSSVVYKGMQDGNMLYTINYKMNGDYDSTKLITFDYIDEHWKVIDISDYEISSLEVKED